MDATTTNKPASKRMRNGSVILTDRMCEKRVAKRVKIYDRKCPGLYVSITAAGVATFSFKFTDPVTGKQRTGWLGIYNPETFAVEDARNKVYGLKGMGGGALAETFREHKAEKARRGRTVDEIIDERIGWMKVPVKKPDGELRPRLESWENTASHLNRFVRPRLGKKLAERSHQARHRDAVERHCRRPVRRPLGQQCAAHAQGSFWPVQLGSGSRPRLCNC